MVAGALAVAGCGGGDRKSDQMTNIVAAAWARTSPVEQANICARVNGGEIDAVANEVQVAVENTTTKAHDLVVVFLSLSCP